MGFFNWSAPFIDRFGQRWTADDIRDMASSLAPCLESEDARVLDVGGGSGGLAVRLADALHRDVIVLDPTPELLVRVPEHARIQGVLGTAEDMPFENATFDAVVITDAFHHFADQEAAIGEVCRVLRPRGGLVVHEFDPRGWMRLVVWGEKLLGEPGAFMTQDEMCRFMRDHGIEGTCTPRRGHEYQFVGIRGD